MYSCGLVIVQNPMRPIKRVLLLGGQSVVIFQKTNARVTFYVVCLQIYNSHSWKIAAINQYLVYFDILKGSFHLNSAVNLVSTFFFIFNHFLHLCSSFTFPPSNLCNAVWKSSKKLSNQKKWSEVWRKVCRDRGKSDYFNGYAFFGANWCVLLAF